MRKRIGRRGREEKTEGLSRVLLEESFSSFVLCNEHTTLP